jgi:chaperonin GroEL
MIENATSEYEKTFLHSRIAKIINGVSIIRIGAQTEMQLREKKLRVEDALNATKSAIQEGVIPGGGVMLLKASKYLETIEPQSHEHTIALSILKKAI